TWKSSDTNVERQADLSLPYRPKSPLDDFRTNRTTISDRADFVAKHSPAFRHPLLSKQKQQQQHQKDDTNASIPKTFHRLRQTEFQDSGTQTTEQTPHQQNRSDCMDKERRLCPEQSPRYELVFRLPRELSGYAAAFARVARSPSTSPRAPRPHSN